MNWSYWKPMFCTLIEILLEKTRMFVVNVSTTLYRCIMSINWDDLKMAGPGGGLMEGTGTGWNNVFLPRATSNQGNSPVR